MQAPVIRALARTAEDIGAKIYLADYVMSPRPTVWFCGDKAQRIALLRQLFDLDIRVFTLIEGERTTLWPFSKLANHAIAYQKHAHNGVVVHGAASGVEIAFCAYNSQKDVWSSKHAGVESEASTTYLSSLRRVSFLGVDLPILGNADALVEQAANLRKIDLVYTWVDGKDPEWKARKQESEMQVGRQSTTADSNHATRYESHEELLFSVRSALRYFVDLGNIYVVTDRQIPHVLGDLLDNVTIVDHRDIFQDKDHLPTFNSHAIEANLHRIPGLRENYLYLNDDVLFGSAMSAANFFDEYGRSLQFHSNAVSLPHETSGEEELAVNLAGLNNRRLLQEKLGVFAFRSFSMPLTPPAGRSCFN
ncbi:stealth family protein [Maritimibacter fusiformis]|nr:stealth family protein [Maritimibacter fusiformis]